MSASGSVVSGVVPALSAGSYEVRVKVELGMIKSAGNYFVQIVPAERSNEVGAASVPVEPSEPSGIPSGMVATRSDYEVGVSGETMAIYEQGVLTQAVRYEMGYGYIDGSGVRHYYLRDNVGSVRVVVRQDGAMEEVNEYYAYGAPRYGWSIDAVNRRMKYTGKETDVETGLEYFGARYLDSWGTRWLGVDVKEGKYPWLSPYVYGANNPLKVIDVDGRDIIVVNRRDGVPLFGGPYGHVAMLVGNDKTGYEFYTKDGALGDVPLAGESLAIKGAYYKSLDEFAASEDGKSYDRGVRLTTDQATDIKAMGEAGAIISSTEYNGASSNCSTLIADVLSKVGLSLMGRDQNAVGISIPNYLFEGLAMDVSLGARTGMLFDLPTNRKDAVKNADALDKKRRDTIKRKKEKKEKKQKEKEQTSNVDVN